MPRRSPWFLIVIWLGFGAAGMAVGRAHFEEFSSAVAWTLSVEAGMCWMAVWIALLVPRIVTLSVARFGIPVGVVGAFVALVASGPDLLTICWAVLATIALGVLALPTTVDAFVDGSSYGPEQRFALRTPLFIGIVAVPFTWAILALIVIAAPLLAAKNWVVGVGLLMVWGVGARFAVRSFHLPARRWVVFVPAGLVVADPLSLVDALLLPRRNIAALGPAFADTDATDLTKGTLGLTLQVDLTEPFSVGLRDGRASSEKTIETERILFAVLRPGALLEQAQQSRINVGSTAPTQAPTRDPNQSHTAVPLPKTRSPR